jgi:hypothetical protein
MIVQVQLYNTDVQTLTGEAPGTLFSVSKFFEWGRNYLI